MCFKVRDGFRLTGTDPSLFLVRTPRRRAWFSRFGGWVSEGEVARRHEELLRCVPARAWAVYQYNSPFWPLLRRRIEIVFTVKIPLIRS